MLDAFQETPNFLHLPQNETEGPIPPASSQQAIHWVDWVDWVETSYGEDDGE
jgi:hypothetical protein